MKDLDRENLPENLFANRKTLRRLEDEHELEKICHPDIWGWIDPGFG